MFEMRTQINDIHTRNCFVRANGLMMHARSCVIICTTRPQGCTRLWYACVDLSYGDSMNTACANAAYETYAQCHNMRAET